MAISSLLDPHLRWSPLLHSFPILPTPPNPRKTAAGFIRGRRSAGALNFSVRCAPAAGKFKKLRSESMETRPGSGSSLARAIVDGFLKALKALRKPALAAVLLGLLLAYDPSSVLAASGGRMGGRAFSSPPSSRSFSSSRPGISFSAPYYAPSPFGFGAGGVYVGPALGFGVGAGSSFATILMGLMAFMFVYGLFSNRSEGGVLTATERVSVLKLQVGLLGMGRSLQRDLNRIAETADTSNSEGLSYVLTETTLALLRHPDYCISGYTSMPQIAGIANGIAVADFVKARISAANTRAIDVAWENSPLSNSKEIKGYEILCVSLVDVKQSVEEGENRFNKLSIEERGKFDEETLVNVNSIRKQSAGNQSSSGFSNEYIVITVLVAAEGVYKLPTINGSGDLKEALQKLGSIPSSRILATEVLWTPQNENDTLSERELLEDYPLLRPL